MIKLQRIILNSGPVSFVLNKSKRIILPGFEGLPLYDVATFFFAQMRRIGLNERAAAIAFNFLMAIPPLCIFFFTLLANLPGSQNLVYNEFLTLVDELTPDESTYKIIQGIANDFFHPGSGFLSFGLISALFFSSNAMITIMRTFDKSIMHIETEKRNFFKTRWIAIKLTLLIVMLIIATIIILITQGALLKMIKNWLDIRDNSINWLVQIIRLLITFILVFYATAFIYRFAPSIEKKWKLNSPGALLATFLIMVFTFLFSYWVNNFATYNKVYGSIGSILILMLLVFVNSLVLLIGFELNVSIKSLKSIALRRQVKEEMEKTE
jgi:membrane protein